MNSNLSIWDIEKLRFLWWAHHWYLWLGFLAFALVLTAITRRK